MTLQHALWGVGLAAASCVAIALVFGVGYIVHAWWEEDAPDWFVDVASAFGYLIVYGGLLTGFGLLLAWVIWGQR